MEKTRIEWANSSWNPVSGCRHTCPYCYARGTANRFKGCDLSPDGSTDQELVVLKERLKVTGKDGTIRNASYPYGFIPTFHEYRLNDPSTKGFGKTIFVCSMADLFGECGYAAEDREAEALLLRKMQEGMVEGAPGGNEQKRVRFL